MIIRCLVKKFRIFIKESAKAIYSYAQTTVLAQLGIWSVRQSLFKITKLCLFAVSELNQSFVLLVIHDLHADHITVHPCTPTNMHVYNSIK